MVALTGDKVTNGDKSPNVTGSDRADLEVTGDTHPLGGVTSVTGARRRKKAPDKVALALSTTRDPTAKERDEIEVAKARQQARPRRLEIIRTRKGDIVEIAPSHADGNGWHGVLRETFGTTSHDFVNHAFGQAIGIVDPRADKQDSYNATLALIAGIAPQNELEATIAVQIAAVNALSLDCLDNAARSDGLERRDILISQATKLSRTLSSQIETLAKLRGGGKQTVEVRYVYVNGNALIGDSAQTMVDGRPRGGGALQNSHRPHAQSLEHLPGAPVAAMSGHDPQSDALPVAGGVGAHPVPDARGD